MSRQTLTKVGTTNGLDNTVFGDYDIEQAYVFTRESQDRPVRVEGWQGYTTKAFMDLTAKQAKELAILLIEAMAVDGS